MDNLQNNLNSDSNSSSAWWRWPLIPFACVLGSILGATLMGLFQWFSMKMAGGYNQDGWYFIYILPIITSATFGYLWVKIANYVAPRGKIVTAVIMTTLLATLLVLTIIFSLYNPSYGISEKLQSVLGGIAMLMASILTIIALNNEAK